MYRLRLSSQPGRALSIAVAIALTGVIAGCGSTSSSSTGASNTAASSGQGGSSSTVVADAQRVVTLAETKLLYGPTTGDATEAQLRAPTAADIHVYPYKRTGTAKSVVIVACSPLSGQCVHTAAVGKEYLAKLGIAATVVDSDYTPAGNQRAMNNALALKPGAIILLAIAPDTIGPQIAQAKSRKIAIVDGYGTAQTDGGNLDAYVPQGSNLYQIAAGAQMIVDTGGKGHVLWLAAPEFPELEVGPGEDYFASVCGTCTLTKGTETAAQVTNPVTEGQLITSSFRANPGLNYLTEASACADLSAAASAIRQIGTGKLAAGGCGASAIAAMNAGYIPFATGEVEPWGMLATIDQVLRLWAGQKPLPAASTGPGAYLVTPKTTPDTSTNGNYGKLDRWTLSLFNYVAPYSKAWGVDLSSVIADEK